MKIKEFIKLLKEFSEGDSNRKIMMNRDSLGYQDWYDENPEPNIYLDGNNNLHITPKRKQK